MDKATFDDRVKRLKQVSKAIEDLDPAIRAAAFSLLSDYVTGKSVGKKAGTNGSSSDSDDHEENGSKFFAKFDHKKPSENALMIAAYFYGEYGVSPFAVDEATEMATKVGVTIPARLDMTYVQAQKKGKNLFHRAGRGMFAPTVHGEEFLKEAFKVSKGKRKRESEIPA